MTHYLDNFAGHFRSVPGVIVVVLILADDKPTSCFYKLMISEHVLIVDLFAGRGLDLDMTRLLME